MRHLSEHGRKMRTTDPISSQFNMLNMYIGIAIIALPRAVAEVGFLGAIFGLIIVNLLSLGSSWFLLKARNRFKSKRIIDLPDLAYEAYGPKMRLLCQSILILANTAFIMAQGMYLGGQADLLACDWLDRPEDCGKNKKFYSFAMITLMSPILLVPNFQKLSTFSSFVVVCCVVSLIAIFAFELQAIYFRQQGTPMRMTISDETGNVRVASVQEVG
jgi:amino acid permease